MNKQQPIGSGFGHRSTAREVIKNINISGKTVIITGGYSGLGLEITKAFAEGGANIIVPARRSQTAQSALSALPNVKVMQLDLADLNSVAEFSNSLLSEKIPIDILINNAGIMATEEQHTGNGWELQFAVNHLGHFALTNRLYPLFNNGARIVSVSSAGHHHSDIRWDDLNFEKGYNKWQAYGQSKTANILFALQLDKYADKNIHAFSLHPGAILTPLQRHLPLDEMIALGWIDSNGKGIDESFKSTEEGAATATWAATAPVLADFGGVYCEDCEIASVAQDRSFKGVMPYAINSDSAKRLWDISASLTGVNAFN